MKAGIAAVIALLVVSTSAFGGLITQTRSWNDDIGNVDLTYTFDQFDDQGGTLTLQSVQIIISVDITGGQRTVDNDDTTSASGSVEIGISGGLSSTDVSLVDGSFQPIADSLEPSTSGSLSVAADDGDTEVGGTAFVSVTGPDAATFFGGTTTANEAEYVASAAWTSGVGYIGAGTYDIDVDFLSFTEFIGFGGIQDAGEPPTSDGEIIVKYNYIPEPASLTLLGLAGLGLLRRRRQ